MQVARLQRVQQVGAIASIGVGLREGVQAPRPVNGVHGQEQLGGMQRRQPQESRGTEEAPAHQEDAMGTKNQPGSRWKQSSGKPRRGKLPPNSSLVAMIESDQQKK